MAGSLRQFRYVSNAGVNYAVQLDESTYETAALGFANVTGDEPQIMVTGSRPLSLRYINVGRVDAGQTIRAKFYVGTLAAFSAIETAGNIVVDGETWFLSTVVGERVKRPLVTDTEQLDGDTDTGV